MKLFNVILYFFIAIIIVGSIGIWLPALLQFFKNNSISNWDLFQNMVTYSTTIIVAGCIDIILSKIGDRKLENIRGVVLLMLFLIMTTFVIVIISTITIIEKNFEVSIWLCSIGVLLAWVLWWFSNWGRDDLKPSNALGGDF